MRFDVSYDGSEYAGWARQPELPTVQGVIEEGLALMLGRSGHHTSDSGATGPGIVCAGRTDAGVHARGQVCHVDLPVRVWEDWGPRGFLGQMNVLLAEDVRVKRVQSAAPGFDARFSALSRRYSYTICDDPVRSDPLERGYVVSVPHRLDLDLMNEAGVALLGEHDFAAFCRHRPEASSVRRLLQLKWARDGRDRAVLHIESDAFCHSMVRSIVGALVAVGEGRRDRSWIEGMLGLSARSSEIKVMPPHGLVLEGVMYPVDEELGKQAERARRRRG